MSNYKERKQRSKQVAAEIEDVFLEESRNQRTGAVEKLANDALFFEDKGGAAPTDAAPKMTRKKLAQMKTLRVEQVLQRSSFVPPVKLRVKGKKGRTVDGGLRRYQSPREKALEKLNLDAALATAKPAVKKKKEQAVYDVWDVPSKPVTSSNLRPKSNENAERVKVGKAAVPVCLPGQSFNPEYEAHQDVLGIAVGKEMDKKLAAELFPIVPPAVLGKIGSVEAGLMEECYEDDDEPESEGEEDVDADNVEVNGKPTNKKTDATGKLTRAQRNKQKRHKESLKQHQEQKQLKRKKTELERIKSYGREIEREENERKNKKLRKEQAQMERRLELPRRLGRQKFEPEPVQVLLSEEVDGSLRRLKGNAMLIRDRFKNAQERELVEPRRPVRKRKKRVKEYVPGSAGRKEEQMYRELLRERAIRQAAKNADKIDVFN